MQYQSTGIWSRLARMRPRWRKVFSDLGDNKLRTALVVISIAIGVFSVGMISGSYIIIYGDMSASYGGATPANIKIAADPFEQDFVDTIANLPDVKDAEGRRLVNVRVRIGEDRWTAMDLIAIDDFENSRINLLLPVDGLPAPGERQVLFDLDALEDITAQVGDQIEFQLPDGTIKHMPLVGVVLDQTTSAGDFLSPPLGYISMDTLEWLGQPENYNYLYAIVAENSNDEAHIRQVSTQIIDKLEKTGRQAHRTRLAKSSEHPMTSIVQAILGVLGALGILIVFLSSSLIANTLNALLNQHLRHIGVMKLVGARSFQIFGMYIVLILTFGAIALVIAIPTGGRAAYALSELIASEMNFNLSPYRIVPAAILIQVAIASLVPLAAGFVPINNGSRISVQRSLSGDLARSDKSTAHSEQNKPADSSLAKRVSRFPRPLLLSLRNTFRRKGRLLLTLITLTTGGAIFIAVFNVRISLHSYIDRIGNYFLADVTLNFDRPYRLSEVKKYAMMIPDVRQVEGWAYASAEAIYPNGEVADNIAVLAPPVDSKLVDPILMTGRWIQAGDQRAIAVSEALLDAFPDLQPGDTLRLKINGDEQDWEVVGIFKFVNTTERTLAYASYDYISEMLNLANQSVSFRILSNQNLQGQAQEEYQYRLANDVDRFFRKNGFHVNEVEAGQSSLKTASEGLDVLVTFLLIMALLTASVGSMGLAGTMGMNVLERTREIGVMRSIGAVDLEIVKTVMVEGMLIGLISWFFGALLSFPISSMLSSIIGLAIFSTPVDLVFTAQGFVIWLVLVLVLSVLASVLPARSAARLTIREVLAYE